jgi:copper chaperone CopZ
MLTTEMKHVEPIVKSVEPRMLLTAATAFLAVGNMHCPHCVNHVHNGLIQLGGVFKVDVFFRQGVAAVTYDPLQETCDNLCNAVSRAGQNTCCYYWAELIGEQPAIQALHLQSDENSLATEGVMAGRLKQEVQYQ